MTDPAAAGGHPSCEAGLPRAQPQARQRRRLALPQARRPPKGQAPQAGRPRYSRLVADRAWSLQEATEAPPRLTLELSCKKRNTRGGSCLLYTSDAADDM
eukprot:6383842-Alexandrium_andersonii.AAC.1